MNSHIKNQLIILFLFFGFLSVAQNTNLDFQNNVDLKNESSNSVRQHLGFIAIDAYLPMPTGTNFVGEGMEGKTSFNLRTGVFVYKQFFVGFVVGDTYLKVTNPKKTGNYTKTTINNQYLYVGYEFLPAEKFRIGLSAGLIGSSRYKNMHFTENDKAIQYDNGKIKTFEVYIDYELSDSFALYFNYAYRVDKTKIEVSSALQDYFSKVKFHTIGIGIKLYIGETAIVSDF